MMKRDEVVSLAGVLIVLFTVLPAAGQQNKLMAAPDIVPPATAEMQKPGFWVDRLDNPDRVIMTPAQIADLMGRNRTRPTTRTDINGNEVSTFTTVLNRRNFSGVFYHMIDPLKLESVPGDSLRTWLKITHDYLKSDTFWDRRQIPVPEAMIDDFITELDEDGVPEMVSPRYGVIVRHTLNRLVPTHTQAYWNQYGWLDAFQVSVLETCMPVAVVHQSKKGDWLYVRSEYSYGWVPRENVAFGSADAVRKFSDPHEFVVSTAHRVPVYTDIENRDWVLDLHMGATLPLVGKRLNDFSVLVPIRDPDGTLGTANGIVGADADVHEGYQPLTQRTIITTFFKLLGRPYGWGGTDHERDCVGAVRAVFRTCGINMPRWTEYELYSSDHVYIFTENTDKAVKYDYLARCMPGMTVCGFDGHVVLYIGEVDSTHYIIHQNGYSIHDEDGTELRVGRVSVNYTEIEGGGDIARWTELTQFVP